MTYMYICTCTCSTVIVPYTGSGGPDSNSGQGFCVVCLGKVVSQCHRAGAYLQFL